MPTFGIDAFLQPVSNTLTYSEIQIPVRMNFLKRVISEILQLSHCNRFSRITLSFTIPQKKKGLNQLCICNCTSTFVPPCIIIHKHIIPMYVAQKFTLFAKRHQENVIKCTLESNCIDFDQFVTKYN